MISNTAIYRSNFDHHFKAEWRALVNTDIFIINVYMTVTVR